MITFALACLTFVCLMFSVLGALMVVQEPQVKHRICGVLLMLVMVTLCVFFLTAIQKVNGVW